MRLDKKYVRVSNGENIERPVHQYLFVAYPKSYPAQLINNINTAYPDSYSYTTTKHFPFL